MPVFPVFSRGARALPGSISAAIAERRRRVKFGSDELLTGVFSSNSGLHPTLVSYFTGESDPANYTLPQQPLHPCLLRNASRFGSLKVRRRLRLSIGLCWMRSCGRGFACFSAPSSANTSRKREGETKRCPFHAVWSIEPFTFGAEIKWTGILHGSWRRRACSCRRHCPTPRSRADERTRQQMNALPFVGTCLVKRKTPTESNKPLRGQDRGASFPGQFRPAPQGHGTIHHVGNGRPR